MPVIEHKVMINRSVTDIFRFVSDFNNNPKWQPPSMQLDKAGKVKIGDMVVGRQRIMGQMQHVNADVVDYSPNQRITYNFNFSGAGGTEVTLTQEIRIPWFQFFLRPLVLGGLNNQVVTSLENLKQFMEGRRDLGG